MSYRAMLGRMARPPGAAPLLGVAVLLVVSGLIPAGLASATPAAPRIGEELPHPAAGGPWTNLTPAEGDGPPGSVGAVMVNDSADGYDLWFGGSVAHAGGAIGATWVFEDGNWTNLTDRLEFSPPARTFAAAAYDAAEGVVVLFGGLGDPTYLNDTWAFHDGNWTNSTPFLSLAPSARAEAAMTYDAATRSLLLFGGVSSAGPLGDTWAYSDGAWSHVLPRAAPPPSCCDSLAYDSTDQEAVLLAADASDAHLYTWSYAAGNWTNRTGTTGPSGRQWGAFVDDPAVGGALLFGGTALPTAPYWPLGDAWIFSGNAWTWAPGGSVSGASPAPRWDAAVAPEVGASACFLLVGGAGINGSVPAGAEVWTGCGDRALWTNGSGTGPGEPNPPSLSLVPTPFGGVAPFTTDLNITVENGTPPFDLSVCAATEGCYSAPPWNGTGPYHRLESFGNPGTYSVSALVTDSDGLSASATASVVVSAPTPLTVTYVEVPVSGVAPLDAQFEASVAGGTPPYSVQWSFGDGTVAAGSPGENLSHVYDTEGTFYPSLEVVDARGQNVSYSLPAIAVHPPSSGPGGSGRGPLSADDELALAILLAGVAVAATVYAVRRRRLKAEVDATLDEVRTAGRPPEGS